MRILSTIVDKLTADDLVAVCVVDMIDCVDERVVDETDVVGGVVVCTFVVTVAADCVVELD